MSMSFARIPALAMTLLIAGASLAQDQTTAPVAEQPQPLQEQTTASSQQQSQPLTRTTFRDVARKVAPAVVNVRIKTGITFKKRSGGIVIPPGMGLSDEMRKMLEQLYEQQAPNLTPEQQEELQYSSSGSGVVIRPDGYIVTSNHVISGTKPELIEVSFPDGKKLGKVKVVGADPMTDVAVIKVDGQNLPTIAWGDSKKMEVGDFVLAVGNPLEFVNSVSEGIISAKHRVIGKTVIEDLIQTTAMINPGNSGGALVNLDGELIGINMAIATSTGMWSGLGFAVPSETARGIVEQIIATGKVVRGYLGIEMTPLTINLAHHLGYDKDYGVIVKNVTPGSAAEKAGIKRYDIISKVEGKEVKNALEMNRLIGTRKAGETVQIELYRQSDGKLQPMTVKATLGERPSEKELAKTLRGGQAPEENEQPSDQAEASYGLSVSPAPSGKGVVVNNVAPESRAALAGIKKGDVILQVNRQDVNSQADLDKALAQSKESQMFYIDRGGETMIVIATTK